MWKKTSGLHGFWPCLYQLVSFVQTPSLEMMVIGRILQELVFLPQDHKYCYYSRYVQRRLYMARIMSFVTVVFILVPVIAPALGKICAGLQSGMDSLYSGSY
jgi:DHA1 family bicyclomycin/chloramphenicol resistance-like MFS transporter